MNTVYNGKAPPHRAEHQPGADHQQQGPNESLREPTTDLWCCSDCGAHIKLHLRRRNPGNCANCGSGALKPWQLVEQF